jgi:hypothetical protein
MWKEVTKDVKEKAEKDGEERTSNNKTITIKQII